MFKRPDALALRKQDFYKQYARKNQVDCLQLQILDLLTDAGGRVTWMMIFEQVPGSRSSIEQAVLDLEAQELVQMDFDRIILTDYAPFVIEEVLTDFNEQFQKYIAQFPEFHATDNNCLA